MCSSDLAERAATELNLHKAGYDGWITLYMRTSATHGQLVSEFKTRMRQEIEAKGYTIIANLGDQISDLVGEAAERCYKLPNPFYFIPGAPAPEGGLKCLRR